jgi:hypothetical protein
MRLITLADLVQRLGENPIQPRIERIADHLFAPYNGGSVIDGRVRVLEAKTWEA